VDPRAGLDAEARIKIICPCRGSSPGVVYRSGIKMLIHLNLYVDNIFLVLYLFVCIQVFLFSNLKNRFSNCVWKYQNRPDSLLLLLTTNVGPNQNFRYFSLFITA
jgi:hypothetical protein